jgi:glycosyltransferase involved in cell wall biosynthesis
LQPKATGYQMENPFFSIILPTYNRANMIGKAIESVLAQTYMNWELLVVDDGSTDNTKQVVEAYNDSRIGYIYQQNAERSAARNNGIAHAKGQYVCFIDSDDYYLTHHLQEFATAIDKGNADMFFGYNVFEQNDQLVYDTVNNRVDSYKNVEEYLVINPVRTAAVCVKREVFSTNLFNLKIRIGEDTELWVRIAANHTLKAVNAYSQVYVLHRGQTVADDNTQNIIQHIECLKVVFKFDNKLKRISNKYRRLALSYGYFKLGQAYMFKNNYFKGFFSLLNSIMILPSNRIKEKVYLIYSHSFIGPKKISR